MCCAVATGGVTCGASFEPSTAAASCRSCAQRGFWTGAAPQIWSACCSWCAWRSPTAGAAANGATDSFTEVPYPFKQGSAIKSALFGLAAWTAHSCTPNVWASRCCPPPALTLIARRPIRAGETITTSLVDEALRSLEERQQLLHALCGLDCQCARCRGRHPTDMCANPAGPCAACRFKLVLFHAATDVWRCGGCGVRIRQLEGSALAQQVAAQNEELVHEFRRLEAVVEASEAPGAAPAYGALRPLQRLAAQGEGTLGARDMVVSNSISLLRRLHTRAAHDAAASATGALPRNRRTRGWPADVVALHARSAQLAMQALRIAECAAAQCAESGGAACTVQHPLLGGDNAFRMLCEASTALK
jgi:ribosomal protein L37AE/L43A